MREEIEIDKERNRKGWEAGKRGYSLSSSTLPIKLVDRLGFSPIFNKLSLFRILPPLFKGLGSLSSEGRPSCDDLLSRLSRLGVLCRLALRTGLVTVSEAGDQKRFGEDLSLLKLRLCPLTALLDIGLKGKSADGSWLFLRPPKKLRRVPFCWTVT